VANFSPPTRETVPPWWSAAAWRDYLAGNRPARAEWFTSDDLFAGEWTTGIGVDAETQTQDGERLYSAEYLRLRPDVRCGFAATLRMKQNGNPADLRECIGELFQTTRSIIVGGQQRTCQVEPLPASTLPLPTWPHRLADFKLLSNGKLAVKWTLLTPAIWPAIAANAERGITAHPGGWLPNWICPDTGKVLLKAGDTERAKGESRDAWRKRVRGLGSIAARLVAAVVPKAVPVTGWTERLHLLQDEGKRWTTTDDEKAHGPRATHLAVPAGSVYYFEAGSPEADSPEADSAEAAAQLAATLNWHGDGSDYSTIKNRRSTLMGEKGYGLGVCGTWQFFADVQRRPTE